MNSNLKFKLDNLPKKPGCYLWKNIDQQVIYVGKAKNLFKRCHQYFNPNRDFKTTKLVAEICDIEFFVVSNENEALILENNLIKKHQPKYNISLKNSNAYPYFVLTNDVHPQLKYTYFFNRYCGKYFGPFAASTFEKHEFKKLIDAIFPLRKCNHIPHKKCLYYDLGQCLGPCINKIDQKQYDTIKSQIIHFFHGKTKQIIALLQDKQKKAAAILNFEQANAIKKIITSIQELKSSQNIQLAINSNIDFLGFSVQDNFLAIGLFKYVNGKLLTKIQEIYEYYDTIEETIFNWIIQYYLKNFNRPKILYISPLFCKHNLQLLTKTLSIKVIHPIKGKKKVILKNVEENLKAYLKNNFNFFKLKKQKLNSSWNKLKEILHLSKLNTLIAIDISNLFNDDKVAGMISMTNGEFIKNNYRRYIIKKKMNSDYECFIYIFERYLAKHANELPDLIIVDGGKIQVKAVLSVFLKLKIIPPKIIGLVKNSLHKTDAIYFNNKIIKLDHTSDFYNFLLKIQNEVHRFSISFFRKKHLQSTLQKK